ncbi:lipase family protein [Sansalvadorimonas sp. 2012CJ34-2]|uniref:Lipase family protein n=1 Tax=Parendozoicomonas callyspongiae TaxID=2942213 RepID=A0ABT0PD87_9GAMM|nr:lipase family protein [Sansalvadorimonas sp. 2012CJ34-2]MCL6269325.1 lipase family protein [Sansalvadorimonas sp. 2012CJ34-2]
MNVTENNHLIPKDAASLARDIYAVQDEFLVKAFLNKPLFSPKGREKKTMSAEVGSRLINTKDGFGVCALGAEQEKVGNQDTSNRHAIIVFRGSTTANMYADWISNFRIGVETSSTGLPVHIGFNSIFMSMKDQIEKFLNQHNNKIKYVHCVGHSLGGAIATITSDWIKCNYSTKEVKLYTFGAPKPGFEWFARKLTTRLNSESVHRVFHSTDPVPMIPLYPFVHAPIPGTGTHLYSSEALLSADAHDMRLYFDSVKDPEASWSSLGDPLPSTSYDKLVEKWLASDGSVNPFNPKTWEWINAGLEYVIKKILKVTAISLQAGFSGCITLADKLALILRKGIEYSAKLSIWVVRLMAKIMQALGMKIKQKAEELTHFVIRYVLQTLMNKISTVGKQAIKNITKY